MPWWGYVLMGVMTSVVLPTWCLVRTRLVEVEKDITALRVLVEQQGKECAARLTWLRTMAEGIAEVRENVARLCGKMEQ